MIFCVGNRLIYERELAQPTPPIKKGRRPDGYSGGYVFKTADDASRFLASKGLTATHGVYGVLAEWETDTAQLSGEPYRRLIRDADVVRL